MRGTQLLGGGPCLRLQGLHARPELGSGGAGAVVLGQARVGCLLQLLALGGRTLQPRLRLSELGGGAGRGGLGVLRPLPRVLQLALQRLHHALGLVALRCRSVQSGLQLLAICPRGRQLGGDGGVGSVLAGGHLRRELVQPLYRSSARRVSRGRACCGSHLEARCAPRWQRRARAALRQPSP